MNINKVINKINGIFEAKGQSQRTAADIKLLILMAKEMEIPPEDFFTFVELLADGKTFDESKKEISENDGQH